MKIGIDARLLSRWHGGSSRYLENMVRELQHIDQENQYYLYSNRDFFLPLEDHRWRKRVHARFPFLPGFIWLQTDAKSMVLRDGLDVFWGAQQGLPLGLPPKLGKVLTVHDFVWRLYPETMALYTYSIHRLFNERWIREADTLIAVSESTARDLEALLRVPKSKIQVVCHGVSPHYQPHDSTAAAQHIARKFRVSENYICTVGTIQPRKNLITLVEAVKILRSRENLRHQLLVAGAKGWKESKIYASVKQHGLTQKDVCFLGFVPEEDMPFLYAGASVFVFPSLYEGFGLPLVEAMACGVPIVASNVPPVPEVVQDGAILVPPMSPEDFAEAITRITTDPELRRGLVERGLKRACHFRWDAAAREMLRVFKEFSRTVESS